ncbi:MAG TPA: sugar ABC transporter permease [Chloroflexota bacterium]|nr:sugar ABC transporter permease [Chloroflexota bacterium]
MSSETTRLVTSAVALPAVRRRLSLLTRQDKLVLALMLGIPTAVHLFLVWLPAIGSIVLSFTRWNGVGGLATIEPIGLKNYTDIFSIYPPFWPALAHNVIWLGVLLFLATPLGMFLAVLLDREIRGLRFYQSVFFLPVVLSLAIIGFIVDLFFAPEQGLVNNVLGTTHPGNLIDWLGTPGLNLIAVLLFASWRHTGYIMILYLSGLKSVDPSLREAAVVDGANARQVFLRVVFPAMHPINVVVLVITIIEALRAFDLVYVVNKGRNGLELISVLVTNNIIGEASRVGFGSALAVILLVISLGAIVPYLWRTFHADAEAA